MTASNCRVPAFPASSTMSSVEESTVENHFGIADLDGLSMRWMYLSRVSVGAVRSAPRLIEAAAVGARPSTVPPELRQACDSAAMAGVFPCPAGAGARATRGALGAVLGARAAVPGLRGLRRG